MKVLFISLGEPDYQCDCLLHGFYNLLGENLTHTDDYFLMYSDKTTPEQLKNISGRGFTMWGNLPKYLNDNTDIERKIKNQYFDYIVYGSIRRCSNYFNLVQEYYPPSKIIFIDGEDDAFIINNSDFILFKRELVQPRKNVFPIAFSIPQEKITNASNINKIKFLADYIPQSSGSGYCYQNEEEYYNNYQEAYYGLTHKKGGWDCMRHYEILANYCIPYFPELEKCPVLTMFNFPKKEILKSNILYHKKLVNDEYIEILNSVFTYTKENLTTLASAKYIINTLQSLQF
jgi:hypothetical protein